MRVGLYARVSSESDEQENALTQQLDRLRAAAVGHEAIEFVEVMSGTRDDRPQLARLMAACQRGELDRVICTRLDRLSRSMANGAELLTYFSAPDTPSLLALDDSLDLATPSGRLMANILISFAVAESDRLSERVRHGKTFHRKKLVPLGPYAPFGYRYNDQRDNYELNPETAPQARALVDRFLKEQTIRPLLRDAVKIPGCSLHNPCSFRRWIGNPTLAGYRVYGRTYAVRDSKGKLTKRMRQPWDWAEIYPDCHPPLISKAQHQQIVKILSNHRNRKRSALSPKYVGKLTGLVSCGNCGRTLYYQHVEDKTYRYLFCHGNDCVGAKKTRIRADVVEAAIWRELRQCKEQLLALALGNHPDAHGDCSSEQALTQQIKELEAQGDPDFAEAIAKKKARLAKLIEQRITSKVTAQERNAMEQALDGDHFWEIAQEDASRCRAFFSELVERVVVRGHQVESIHLRLPSGGEASPCR